MIVDCHELVLLFLQLIISHIKWLQHNILVLDSDKNESYNKISPVISRMGQYISHGTCHISLKAGKSVLQ